MDLQEGVVIAPHELVDPSLLEGFDCDFLRPEFDGQCVTGRKGGNGHDGGSRGWMLNWRTITVEPCTLWKQ